MPIRKRMVQASVCMHCGGALLEGRPLRNFCTKSHYTMWLYENNPKYRYNQQQQWRKDKPHA